MKGFQVLEVTQLNRYIKSILDGDQKLQDLFVKGEISNFSLHYKSGHMYFTLKDKQTAVKAVMFQSHAKNLPFLPEDGMRVVVRGSVSVYEREGAYQLYAYEIQPDGIGALHLAYEQLKERLFREGLFDADQKKPLPPIPEQIGIVTSAGGAALQDILHILNRRCPFVCCRVYPVLVQGEGASQEIIQALQRIEREKREGCWDCDLIILARGGGSLEDLWAFNNEQLARTIFQCTIPVIAAIGHETDFTIADFVADLRAPTPSAAAELAVPDGQQLLLEIQSCRMHLAERIKDLLQEKEWNLLSAAEALPLLQNRLLEERERRLQRQKEELSAKIQWFLQKKEETFRHDAALLSALNPLAVLSRGFSMTADIRGKPLRFSHISPGETIQTIFREGIVYSQVLEKEVKRVGTEKEPEI